MDDERTRTRTALRWLLAKAPPPHLPFPRRGTAYEGTVLGIELTQQRNYKTKALEYWDNEGTEPKMQAVITLDMGRQGLGRLFAKHGMGMAIAEAMRDAGLHTVDASFEGWRLRVEYVRDERSNDGGEDAKVYRAQLTAPRQSVTVPASPDGNTADEPEPPEPEGMSVAEFEQAMAKAGHDLAHVTWWCETKTEAGLCPSMMDASLRKTVATYLTGVGRAKLAASPMPSGQEPVPPEQRV